MASERGLFDIGDVIEAITAKLIRRHPHVFGPDAAKDAESAKARWDDIKAAERAGKAEKRQKPASLLDDVPRALPALVRAEKLAKRAASVDFDWPDWPSTMEKVREEIAEVEAAANAGDEAKTAIEAPPVIARILEHLGRDTGSVDPAHPSRAPPQGDLSL
jgi:uncharacterized protein YabN with tetrapyrrole methylase and pyrophosphatase domain